MSVFRLPPSYALRNLLRRPLRSLATIFGIAVVLFAVVLMLALARGLDRRIGISGEPRNVLVLNRTGQNLMMSAISEDELVHLAQLPGLALDAYGRPAVSPETMHMATVRWPGLAAERRSPVVYVRGITPMAWEVHKSVCLVRGRLPEKGDELVVGTTTHVKLGAPAEALEPGGALMFEGRTWKIVGVFEAAGSLVESEVWMDARTLHDALRRRTYTFAVARLSDEAAMPQALAQFSRTGALERFFKGWSEREYYSEFGAALAWVRALALAMVGILIAAGALMGANTMYTAVLNRVREIATCRVLGYSNGDILASFVSESLVLALAGGLAGTAAGLVLNGLPLNLSYGAFYLVVDAAVMAMALGLAALIGVAGGALPVLRALRLTHVEGLRHA